MPIIEGTKACERPMLSSEVFRRVKCCAGLVALFFAISATDLLAQAAVVKRNVILREGPAKTTTKLATLQKNDELTLLEPQEVDGYYNVRVANGDEGWVYGAYIRVLNVPPAPTTPTGPPEVYRSCTLEGNAVAEFRRQSNTLKNRVTAPTVAEIDQTITLEGIAAPGERAALNEWAAAAQSIDESIDEARRGGKSKKPTSA